MAVQVALVVVAAAVALVVLLGLVVWAAAAVVAVKVEAVMERQGQSLEEVAECCHSPPSPKLQAVALLSSTSQWHSWMPRTVGSPVCLQAAVPAVAQALPSAAWTPCAVSPLPFDGCSAPCHLRRCLSTCLALPRRGYSKSLSPSPANLRWHSVGMQAHQTTQPRAALVHRQHVPAVPCFASTCWWCSLTSLTPSSPHAGVQRAATLSLASVAIKACSGAVAVAALCRQALQRAW